jgi:hypothetical protein
VEWWRPAVQRKSADTRIDKGACCIEGEVIERSADVNCRCTGARHDVPEFDGHIVRRRCKHRRVMLERDRGNIAAMAYKRGLTGT